MAYFCQNWKIFKTKRWILISFFLFYSLWVGLLVRVVTENIRQFLLGFFNSFSSLSRYRSLVFRTSGSNRLYCSMSHTVWLGEIQCPNGLSLEKLKNFQNKKEILISFLLFYSLWVGLLVRVVTENIRQFLLGFFNCFSSLSRYRSLVFRILKICLAVPSGSHIYLMIHWSRTYK